jgi:hypothetical protein
MPVPTATMTQTATFPNLESMPTMATQAFLYFNSTMGALTEVDVVASGSFSTQFSTENMGAVSTAITGTTSGQLSINLPSGPIPVTIPSVTETFNAPAFDGSLNDAGISGKSFAPVTSNSAAQTIAMSSPADLADFTGNFRIPISVTGHATGSATASDADLSSNFKTQTSATITIIYHYTPNLQSLDPSTSTGQSSQPTGTTTTSNVTSQSTSSGGAAATGASSTALTTSTKTVGIVAHSKVKKTKVPAVKIHKPAHHPVPPKPAHTKAVKHHKVK